MDDLITWLRAQIDEDERAALLALQGHDVSDPATMPPDKRAARWCSDYERLSVIVDDSQQEMCTVGPGANWHAASHIARHDPARVLREVEAKREIIEQHPAGRDHPEDGDYCLECGHFGYPSTTLRLLALPYSDCPGYQEEWQP